MDSKQYGFTEQIDVVEMILMLTDWCQKPFCGVRYIKKKGKPFLRWYIIFGCASDLLMSAKAVCLNTTDLEQMLSAL